MKPEISSCPFCGSSVVSIYDVADETEPKPLWTIHHQCNGAFVCHPFLPPPEPVCGDPDGCIDHAPEPVPDLSGAIERITSTAIMDRHGQARSLPLPACHYKVSIELFEPSEKPLQLPSGFVTNRGRFVGRREARRIAVAAGQVVSDKTYQPDVLFSEDFERAAPEQMGTCGRPVEDSFGVSVVPCGKPLPCPDHPPVKVSRAEVILVWNTRSGAI